MLKRQCLAVCHADHLLNQINTGDQLGHRVFHLKACVHLEEVEVAVAVYDKLNCTSGRIAHGSGQGAGLLAHGFAGRLIQKRRRRFFDDFLVTALNRTLALAQIKRVSMRIRQHLNFDMARLCHEFLDENAVIAKTVGRLILGRLEPLTGFGVIPRNTHPLTAAASRGLDHHRVAHLVRDFDRVVRVLDQPHVPWHSRYVRFLGQLFGRDLVAHGLNRASRWSDKRNTLCRKRLGEKFVLGQKAVSRMNRFRARLANCIHHFVDHDVGLIGGRRPDVNRFIGHLHVQRIAVGVRINSDSRNAHFACSLDNTTCNFTAVCDQDLFKHGVSFHGLTQRQHRS